MRLLEGDNELMYELMIVWTFVIPLHEVKVWEAG